MIFAEDHQTTFRKTNLRGIVSRPPPPPPPHPNKGENLSFDVSREGQKGEGSGTLT